MQILIVCGVSGCGKSTVGKALADKLNCSFVEGDDFHPPANVAKMSSGTALTDDDRTAWLERICGHIKSQKGEQIVLACSALTPYVQDYLKSRLGASLEWIQLEISRDETLRRMKTREHFMPASLMDSQFKAWSPPENGIRVSAEQPVNDIVDHIVLALI